MKKQYQNNQQVFDLTRKDVKRLLLGCGFLSTGGGLPENIRQRLLEAALSSTEKVRVVDVNELDNGDMVATVFGVGDPKQCTSVDEGYLESLVTGFQRRFGLKVNAIIPGEIGAEAEAIFLCSVLGLPLVDADLASGRAVPEVNLSPFDYYGISPSPLLARDYYGNELVVTSDLCSGDLEFLLRTFGNYGRKRGCFLVGYAREAKVYKKMNLPRSISMSLDIGKALEKKNLTDIKEVLKNVKVYEETVKGIVKSNLPGFNTGVLLLRSGLSIDFKNECITLRQGDQTKTKAPDIVTLLDDNFSPVYLAEIENFVGKRVFVVTAKAFGIWDTQKGRQMWARSVRELMEVNSRVKIDFYKAKGGK
ncbi:MAG: DUF917 domain-containing protein [Deltaproteobacteria bacterium]|nr:DUF917 domain-containing protein [Deltaproteobacteria bacterium]